MYTDALKYYEKKSDPAGGSVVSVNDGIALADATATGTITFDFTINGSKVTVSIDADATTASAIAQAVLDAMAKSSTDVASATFKMKVNGEMASLRSMWAATAS